MRKLRVALCQMNSVVGDLDGNIAKMKEMTVACEENGVGIVVFPELAIPGYPPQDAVLYNGLNRDMESADDEFFRFLQNRAMANNGQGAIVVWGNIRRGIGLRNSAKIFIPGQTVKGFPATEAEYQDKRRLPNYGVFDELRYFRPGDDEPSKLFSSKGLTFGVTICEDIWYQQNYLPDFALNGAQVVININASPFHVGKPKYREDMIRARAGDNQVFVLYANMVGGQGGIVFDGDSMIVGPKGNLIARANLFEEDILYADLDLDEVDRVRLKDIRLNSLPRPTVEMIPFEFFPSKNKGDSSVPNRSAEAMADIAQIHKALVLMVRDYVQKQGLKGAVIGLSGGIDSAVCGIIA
ncbi:MAG: nitrilase-related carbon-nitrogen hydrolase, partial [Candidatus Spechtbacterales bacterium]